MLLIFCLRPGEEPLVRLGSGDPGLVSRRLMRRAASATTTRPAPLRGNRVSWHKSRHGPPWAHRAVTRGAGLRYYGGATMETSSGTSAAAQVFGTLPELGGSDLNKSDHAYRGHRHRTADDPRRTAADSERSRAGRRTRQGSHPALRPDVITDRWPTVRSVGATTSCSRRSAVLPQTVTPPVRSDRSAAYMHRHVHTKRGNRASCFSPASTASSYAGGCVVMDAGTDRSNGDTARTTCSKRRQPIVPGYMAIGSSDPSLTYIVDTAKGRILVSPCVALG
jgi:hypothetical protein